MNTGLIALNSLVTMVSNYKNRNLSAWETAEYIIGPRNSSIKKVPRSQIEWGDLAFFNLNVYATHGFYLLLFLLLLYSDICKISTAMWKKVGHSPCAYTTCSSNLGVGVSCHMDDCTLYKHCLLPSYPLAIGEVSVTTNKENIF